MDIYIDKDNLLSYIRSAKREGFLDCERWFKSNADIYFNFTKEEIENESDIDKKTDIKLWLKGMTEGAQTKQPKWNSHFPIRPLKSNTHKSFNKNQLSAIYLVNDEKIELLINNGNIMFVPLGNEVDSISSLFFTDFQFTKCINPSNLKTWEQLCDSPLPCSDIIIADKFILSDVDLVKSNIYKIVEYLSSKVFNSKVNVVVFTAKDKTFSEVSEVLSDIKKYIKKITGIKFCVTIVAAYTLKNEHDRTIFTNYMLYNSGDSFNYFDGSNNLITKGRYLYIKSNAFKLNMKESFVFIEDMQKIIYTLLEENSGVIVGDKKCNYFDFNIQENCM